MDIMIGTDTFPLGVLSPFAFTLDRQMQIGDVQSSLAKLCPSASTKPFHELMKIKRPWSVKPEFGSLVEYTHHLYLLELIDSRIVLRGQFVLLPKEGKLLFIGSPWITDSDELVKSNLSITDFALSDSVVDMMQLLKVQDINLKDIQVLNQNIKKSEELYRHVIEATNDGIWDWDIANDQVHLSNRFKEMLGYDQELGSHKDHLLALIHKEDLRLCRDTIVQHFQNKTPIAIKLRLYHKEGSVRWMVCKGFALFHTDGNPYRMVGTITDVTDATETELTLQRAKEAAEESTKAKEIFLANMSHEIRTPLNAILGMTRLLDKVTFDARQKEFLNAIKYSADNLLVIINDILDLAKIDEGKLDLEKIPFDIAEAVRNAVHSLVYKAEEKGIALTYQLPFEHFFVQGDPFRLNQILLNLLNNAIKFTKNGKVELSVFEMGEGENCFKLKFKIMDTGIGIPESKLGSIFDSFTQANESTARRFGGTGLGLTICKKLVEMQKGKIEVESQVGQGSIFSFEICYPKAKQEDAALLSDEKLTVSNALQNIRVLLAEDNEINQFLATEMLSSWGCHVEVARDGKEALALWQGNPFDIILMDIQMPQMGGVEATLEIRKHCSKEKASIPIIALTANALKGDREKYLCFGMDDHVAKPFKESILFHKVLALVSPSDISTVPSLPPSTYDYARIEQISKGNKAFEKKVLSIFVESVPPSLAELKTSWSNKDFPSLARQAHKLKTTIHSLAISQLVVPITRLEDFANQRLGNNDTETLVLQVYTVMDALVKEFIKRIG